MTPIFQKWKILDPFLCPWHVRNPWSIRVQSSSFGEQFCGYFMTRYPNMRFPHHGGLINRSVLVTPFFELEPAAFHVNIVHSTNDWDTCIWVSSMKIGVEQNR
jgi:hypothetical protein